MAVIWLEKYKKKQGQVGTTVQVENVAYLQELVFINHRGLGCGQRNFNVYVVGLEAPGPGALTA